MKIKKTKKAKKQRGDTTHGHGARKKWKKSGHKGGVGMAGSGKRGDQKKTMITAKYGKKYFGKQGITSRGTARKVSKILNVGKIDKDFDGLMKKFGKGDVLDLGDYKILGSGELNKKVRLKVREISDSALEKIKKAGGEIIEIKFKKEISGGDEAEVDAVSEGEESVEESDK